MIPSAKIENRSSAPAVKSSRRRSSGTREALEKPSSTDRLHAAAERLEALPGALARRVHPQRERVLERAVGQALDRSAPAHQPLAPQLLGADGAPGREARELPQVHDRVRDARDGPEPALREPPLQRHLPAFVAGRRVPAAARAPPFVSPSGGLPPARAGPAPDAPAPPRRPRGRMEPAEIHPLSLRLDEVCDLAQHAAHGPGVLEDDRLANAGEPEPAQRATLARVRPDGAAAQRHLDHALAHPRSSSTLLPRSAATCSGGRSSRSAAIAARTMLWGLFEPRHLVSTSATPASSTTARTPPPAITPVPAEAGRSSTVPAPNRPTTSCGIVPSTSGTSTRSFFAFSMPLRIASGTSLALPRPNPTRPRPSPTTTSALKLKRRPPLTTFATRLM